MYSFLPTEQTASLVFLNICLLLIMYMLMKKALRPPYIVPAINRRFTIILMFTFVLFSFWGPDWFHYHEDYTLLKLGGRTHIEDIYYWIAQNLSFDYLSFRFAVWGSGLILYILTLKRLPISNDLIIFIFSCLLLPYFSYARVSLAMALGFYGLAVLYKPYRFKQLSYLLAIVAILGSFYFHKSALFLIIIIILTIIIIKIPRKAFWGLVILYPIIIYLMKDQVSEFVHYEMDSSNGSFNSYMQAGQQNMSNEEKIRGIGAAFSIFVEILPYITLCLISIRIIIFDEILHIPKNIYAFIVVFVLLVACSSIFMFDMGVNTDTVYIRFIRFAAIPASIVLSFFIMNNVYPKYTRFCLFLFLIAISYKIIYVFYNNLL